MESTQQPDKEPVTANQAEGVDAAKKPEKKDGKAEREAKKAARLAERQGKAQKEAEYKKDPADPCADKFGDLELNRSQSDPEQRYAKKFTEVHALEESLAG